VIRGWNWGRWWVEDDKAAGGLVASIETGDEFGVVTGDVADMVHEAPL
jgi:hypothetical protein